MALKAFLETLDGVDDAVKPFYTENDGKFVLAVEDVDNHPEVANLKSAYEKTKADKEKAKTDAKNLAARIAELEKGAPDTAATQAKITQLQEQLAEALGKVTDLSGKLTGVTRDRALTDALAAAGVTNPTFLKASQALLSGSVKMGEDGTAYVETGMGPKVLADFVKSWTAGEGKAFVTPPAGGGGGGNDKGAGAGKTVSARDLEDKSPAEKAKFFAANPGITVTD